MGRRKKRWRVRARSERALLALPPPANTHTADDWRVCDGRVAPNEGARVPPNPPRL